MIELNKIYCEDNMVTMSRMEDKSVQTIITSPPYNKSRASLTERALKNYEAHYKEFDDRKENEEYVEWILARFKEFERILKDDGVICFNMSYSTDEIRMSELMWLVVAAVIKNTGLTTADCIVWKKKNATPNNVSPNKMTRIVEFVFIFCKRDHYDTFHCNKRLTGVSSKGQNIYESYYNIIQAMNNDEACPIHKATFSTSLCFQLLDRYGVRGGLTYDPFMGTGTLAIAALEQKMTFVGSEISEEYVNYAEQRIKNYSKQLSLW